MALGELLQEARRRDPDKPALRFEDQCWNYAHLAAVTDQVGAGLRRAGVQPGDRVALFFTNRPELVFCAYACFKIGAVVVPLNSRLKGPETEYPLQHCGARVLIAEAALYDEVQEQRSHLPRLKRCYVTGDLSHFSDARPFEELLNGGPAATGAAADFPLVGDDAPAVILYTSGTTARPKGVTHSHATLQQMVARLQALCDLQPEDVYGAMVPLCHMGGFGAMMVPALSTGATLLILPRFEPVSVLRSLAVHRVSVTLGMPVMYNAFVHCPEDGRVDLSALRCAITTGDSTPAEVHRRFAERFGVALQDGCGMTEIAPYCANPLHGPRKVGSIGPPAAGAHLRLVDGSGKDVPPRVVGEVLVQSEATMIGYWDDPESTTAAMQEGWLHTGDLARKDEDGYYWFAGRKKEIIIRGGSNISPQEVEDALYRHPAVKEAGVIGVPDPTWGEVVHAFVALQGGKRVSEAELQQFLQERLAAYKIPERIRVLPGLPKGPTGKVHRQTLRAFIASQAEG